MTAAHYQEDTRSWDVTLAGRPALLRTVPGHRRRRALGSDDADHPRRRDFQGQSCHTHDWPKELVAAGRAPR